MDWKSKQPRNVYKCPWSRVAGSSAGGLKISRDQSTHKYFIRIAVIQARDMVGAMLTLYIHVRVCANVYKTVTDIKM